MREHEKRYRSAARRPRATDARAQYRRVADKLSAESKNRQMTYDDYLAQLKDGEKIIEVDDDSRWTKIKDAASEYFAWVSDKRQKYTPIVKQKLKTVAKRVAEKQPVLKQKLILWVKAADTRLEPLKQRFGAKNVYFTGITGISVLVLLGGFMALTGGGDSKGSEVAVSELETGAVQGAETPVDPTFDVIIPKDGELTSAIKFDPSQGVASYQDQVNEHALTVSQQPLTDAQKEDRDAELTRVSVALLADISFETQFGTTYLTNTAPDGTTSQVVFFMTEELLVFIRTGGSTLTPDEWVEYINSIN